MIHNAAHGPSDDIGAALSSQRTCIAQMLHDDVCGNLAALLYDLHWIVSFSDQAEVRARANISLETVKAALSVSDRVLSDLQPADLENGLTAAITVLMTRFCHRTGIRPKCDIAANLDALPQATQLCIYRTVQEGLTNILKHAQASEASICIGWDAAGIKLRMTDNGRGPDAQMGFHSGRGIGALTQRAQALGGHFEVRQASDGQGTCVELRLPPADSFN